MRSPMDNMLVSPVTVAEIIGYGQHNMTEQQIDAVGLLFADYFTFIDKDFDRDRFIGLVTHNLSVARERTKKRDYEGIWFRKL